MKLLSGVLVVTAVLLSACGAPPPEGTAAAGEPVEARTSEYALRGDCSVSVQCSDGSTRSCNGTSSSCSAGVTNGIERVTCNGSTTSCPTAPPPLCSVEGMFCTSNSQCGPDAFCYSKRCVCLA